MQREVMVYDWSELERCSTAHVRAIKRFVRSQAGRMATSWWHQLKGPALRCRERLAARRRRKARSKVPVRPRLPRVDVRPADWQRFDPGLISLHAEIARLVDASEASPE